jgi:hypothetical protein
MVPGARVTENAVEVVQEVQDRTATTPAGMTSDADPAYETAISQVDGTLSVSERAVVTAVVLGTDFAGAPALEPPSVSRTITTSLLERQHATDRGRNARKARRTYRFSKDWQVHEAMTDFTMLELQLRLAGPNATAPPRGGSLAASDTSHVGRRGRPGLVAE